MGIKIDCRIRTTEHFWACVDGTSTSTTPPNQQNFFLFLFLAPCLLLSSFLLLLSFCFNVHNFGNKTESPFKISASAEMSVWLPSYTTTSYQNSWIVSNANQTIFFRFLVRYNFKSNRLFAFLLLLLLFYSLFVFVLLFLWFLDLCSFAVLNCLMRAQNTKITFATFGRSVVAIVVFVVAHNWNALRNCSNNVPNRWIGLNGIQCKCKLFVPLSLCNSTNESEFSVFVSAQSETWLQALSSTHTSRLTDDKTLTLTVGTIFPTQTTTSSTMLCKVYQRAKGFQSVCYCSLFSIAHTHQIRTYFHRYSEFRVC